MLRVPLAYLITFSTYGTWLQGRKAGWVDRQHNVFGSAILQGDAVRERWQRQRMRQSEYVLDAARRVIVLRTLIEVSSHRMWRVWAAHVRSNHLHVVVTAPCKPEKAMSDFKSWGSRRLREAFEERADRERWTEHGSTKYLWNDDALTKAVKYVVAGQGGPMAVYDYCEGMLLGTAEAEVAGRFLKDGLEFRVV
jgi:REP element-mobilizing transposase RayT